MEKSKYDNYRYYKGEENCPFDPNTGKSVWWRIERYAFINEDSKIKDTLSETMLSFIRERIWQSESGGSNTTWETGILRSTELYKKGLWSASYISSRKASINDAY